MFRNLKNEVDRSLVPTRKIRSMWSESPVRSSRNIFVHGSPLVLHPSHARCAQPSDMTRNPEMEVEYASMINPLPHDLQTASRVKCYSRIVICGIIEDLVEDLARSAKDDKCFQGSSMLSSSRREEEWPSTRRHAAAASDQWPRAVNRGS